MWEPPATHDEPLGMTELHALTDEALIDELRALRQEEAALAAQALQHQSLTTADDDDHHPTDNDLACSPGAPSLASDKENGARAAAELTRKADVGERLYQNALSRQQRKRQAATQQAVERALQAPRATWTARRGAAGSSRPARRRCTTRSTRG